MTNKIVKYKPVDPVVSNLVEQFHRDPKSILEIFVELQEKLGWLSQDTVTDVARTLNIPPEKAYGVASFYSLLNLTPKKKNIIRVCDGPVCWRLGHQLVREKLNQHITENPDWAVERSSCLGLCDRAPAALVNDRQVGPLNPDLAGEVLSGWIGQMPDYSQARPGEVRVMMAKAGKIDPDAIESTLENGGYAGLRAALASTPLQVIEMLEASGLQGRGGAGFPVGRKWRFVAQESTSPKYIICNADESEPLIFKDRVLIDTNPHQILEGIAIAGYATDATEAFIYIRGKRFNIIDYRRFTEITIGGGIGRTVAWFTAIALK